MFGIKRIYKYELDWLLGVNTSMREYLEIFSMENYKENCKKDDEGYYIEVNDIKLYMEEYKTKSLCLYFEKENKRYYYIQ